MAELQDAASAKLLDGDPLQPYLVLVIPQADFGGIAEWQQFVDLLKILWDATGVLDRIAGGCAFFELFRQVRSRRSAKAIEAINSNSGKWSERGGRPSDLVALVARKPRRATEIAGLLGCDVDEAEAVLWALGCAPDGEMWTYRGDPAAAFIADDLELAPAIAASAEYLEEDAKEVAQRRLQELGEAGTAPPLGEERLNIREALRRGVEEELEEM